MTNTAVSQRIFISYRRSDCQSQANAVNDGLGNRLPDASIFMDIDSIPAGVDFEEHIRNEITTCDVVLVMIGDNWLDPIDDAGTRRIDQPEDFVRLEVENALQTPGVQVVPVLVEGAAMPGAHQLPQSISRLGRLNAIEMSDRRWKADISRLADVVQGLGVNASRKSVTLADLNGVAIEAAVRQAYPPFQTKDIAEAPAVVAAHADIAKAGNFATMVGTYLSTNSGSLGIVGAGSGPGDRGQIWQRASAPSFPPPVVAPTFADAAPTYPPPLDPAASYPTPQQQWVPSAPPSASAPVAVMIVFIVLSAVSLGFLAWIPLVVGLVKSSDKKFWGSLLAAYVVLFTISGVLVLTSPEDASGAATGPQSGIGAVFALLGMGVGIFGAIRYRKLASH